MCYLVPHEQADAARGGATPQPGEGLRSRWIGAAGLALIGGLAMAALVLPPMTPPQSGVAEPAAAIPVLARTAAPPASLVVEQRSGSTAVDDGVPSATEVSKAGSGYCHHGM
jgi:hypothetical protein